MEEGIGSSIRAVWAITSEFPGIVSPPSFAGAPAEKNPSRFPLLAQVDLPPAMLHGRPMKTATISDLRTRFPFLEAWLRAGEEIAITKQGVTIARLVPEAAPAPAKGSVFDDLAGHFRRQRRETWGDRVFSAEDVTAMDAAEREGHEAI